MRQPRASVCAPANPPGLAYASAQSARTAPREDAAMSQSTPQLRVLSLALKACGGEAPLAKALNVSGEDLSVWISGRDPMPPNVYLRARKIIAPRR